MTTATVGNEVAVAGVPWGRRLPVWALAVILFAGGLPAAADPVLGPWIPLFRGIDHLVATNETRGTDFANLSVAYALRIDLDDPDLRFLPSPRIDEYAPNFRETAGMTVSRYVEVQGVQAAINAGFFRPGEYYLPEGTAMAVNGLQISRGESISPASFDKAACLLMDESNHAQIIATNWPPGPTNGVWTAVSGDYPVLVAGRNIGRQYLGRGGIHDVNPRTAIGLSEDRRFLYWVVIDGRQPGYSDGAWDYETAGWLQVLGAFDGINMDGGGSSTMAVEDVTGRARRLNRSSAVADSGRERTVGSHLGVFARPLEGFIHQIVAKADDDAASLTWRTQLPATSQVEYGPTPELGLQTAEDSALRVSHAVRLTGLQPGTGYYFRLVSREGGTRHVSTDQFLTTLSYFATNEVLTLTNGWRHASAPQADASWTLPGYDDVAWSGPDPALLWVDGRSSGPNPDVQPKATELPIDTGTGFPFVTYYFRTRFPLAQKPAGATLFFTGRVDDGAVIYLNGQEIHRLRMDPSPTLIAPDTLASGFPCEGDASCPDEFSVGVPESDALVAGDNVLAVEVHNYAARSPDATFGLGLVVGEAQSPPETLGIEAGTEGPVLTWTRGGFQLEQAPSPGGPWAPVEGPVILSPYPVPDAPQPTYYRLAK